MHVVVITPAETMEAVRSYPSIAISLSRTDSGSASALFFSRLAQRSLRLQPTCSRSRLNDPLRRRLQQLRCLYCCFGCYRVERTSSRAGQTPAEKHRLPRRTPDCELQIVCHVTKHAATYGCSHSLCAIRDLKLFHNIIDMMSNGVVTDMKRRRDFFIG
jgi:hypothetical protein